MFTHTFSCILGNENLMLEQDLIEADFDDLSDAEILVMLLIPDGVIVSRTRLQYLAFLYRVLYEKRGPKA